MTDAKYVLHFGWFTITENIANVLSHTNCDLIEPNYVQQRYDTVAMIATFFHQGCCSLEGKVMRNRIGHLVSHTLSHAELCHRPTLTLHADRPITVDMERFFEFSFSFAEELVDLEEKFQPSKTVVSLERELVIRKVEVQLSEFDFDVDARWM